MQDFEQLQPLDKHNQKLQSHVHPLDYNNPEPEEKYNLVVIGAGTAGLVAASIAAGLGGKVALVERALMGGDCLNVGCVPSKAIISAARSAALVRKASEFGVNVNGEVSVDFPKVMERMRELRSDISPNDSVARFKEKGIDVFLGQAKFTSNDTVEVDGIKLKFAKAVIATGARASAPAIKGLDTVDYLTNEKLFSLTELPKRFGIIGAGPIGAEMGQSFARFGSEVTLVTSKGGLMPKEDPEAARIVRKSMEHDGVKFVGGAHEIVVAPEPDGTIRMKYDHPQDGYDFVVDRLLVAVGRAPNVEGLGLENVGVEYTAKGVKINDKFQTTNPKIYAAGDICSPYQFTHAADFMARAVVRNALFKGNAKHSALIVPWATYTSPELAHVGLTAQTAREQGIEIDTYLQPMAEVDRAILEGETEGFVKIHVKKGSDEIVGATIVAPNAGDMICEISLAMTQKIGLGSVANAIHPYPTQGEAVRKVGDLYGRTRLTPFVEKMFKKWLAWTR
jgi:pyruvate/2-oxoglutarate dehydrogenase complex dihydrolipoamide dehydrogenase (E3) component